MGDSISYHFFKNCDLSISQCYYYMIDEKYESEIEFLMHLNKGDVVDLFGEGELRGAAAGSSYTELTGDIEIDLYE